MAAEFPDGAYLAFDLGASSGRAMLGSLIARRLEVEEVHRFDTPLVHEGDRLYWDVDSLSNALHEGVKLALGRAPALRSLSVDSWGVDYVPLNRHGDPVRRPYAYRDPRVAGMIEKAETRVSRERIYAETGIQFMEINTLYQVLADKELEPDLVRLTRNRLTIADYFNYLFSRIPVDEVSLASTTQLLQASTQQWSEWLLDAFELATDDWPELVRPGTDLGEAHAYPGVQVIAGCSHDTACAVAAVPALDEGGSWAYLSCGTWSLLGVELQQPRLGPDALAAGFTNEAGLDGTIRFLKNMTGLWVLQECEREWKERGERISYAELMAEAQEASSPEAPVDLDDERFSFRGGMEEKLLAYCRERGMREPSTRGELVRLIVESLADAHRRTLRLLEATIGHRIETLHLVGGGSQNGLLCRLTAEACACRVVAGPAEATAIGNLLIQARTMGDLPEGLSIRDVVRNSVVLREYDGSPRAGGS